MALTSISAVCKKLSQGSSGPLTVVAQPDQFRQSGYRMAQRMAENTHCTEVTIGTQRFIEVIRHIFAREIGDSTYAIERQPQGFGAGSHAGRFHLNPAGSLRPQNALLFGRPRHMVDGANHAHARGGPAAEG